MSSTVNQRRPFFCLLLTCLLLTIAVGSQASMYMCRGKGGSISFTNAPTSSSCSSYNLSAGTTRSWSTSRGPVNRSQYDGYIRTVAQRYQIAPPLIKAIIHTESDFDHRAVSKKGARGLMQLMPDTARELRVADPFNPRQNIDGGTRYLRYLLDNFNGNLVLSLAAYNAGPGLVSRTGGVPQIPETKRYIKKVLSHYEVYKRTM